jgi:hypothetical protein
MTWDPQCEQLRRLQAPSFRRLQIHLSKWIVFLERMKPSSAASTRSTISTLVFIGNPNIPKLFRKESMQYEGSLILGEGILVVVVGGELEGMKIAMYLRASYFLMDVQVRLSCFQ